jgi:hypothetical protein
MCRWVRVPGGGSAYGQSDRNLWRRYLSPADSKKVDSNFVPNRVQLLRQQQREVCCLALPTFRET